MLSSCRASSRGILAVYPSRAFLLQFFADNFNLAKVADYSGQPMRKSPSPDKGTCNGAGILSQIIRL